MATKAPNSPNKTPPAPEKPCPYCREPIHAEAKKCRFCGELLEKPPSPSKFETTLKKAAMYVGLATTQ